MRIVSISIVVAGVTFLSLGRAGAQGQPSSPSAPGDCAALTRLRLPDVRISASVAVPPQESPGPITVAHCRVSGVIGTEIRFHVLLPDNWNGRFLMGGGGGFVAGVANQMAQDRTARIVDRGFATAGTDTGHQASSAADAEWALHNLERQVNWGHLAVHRTTEVAKAIIRAYYQSDPAYSFFLGCSNGGRQALVEAQRYPEDFDGIVAIAPALEWSHSAASYVRNMQAVFPDRANLNQSVITRDNLRLLGSAVNEACDERDGIKDGVIDDPRACSFSLDRVKSCFNDQAAAECLTRRQRAAIELIYAPTVTPDGQIYPGQPLGGEAETAGWRDWIAGINPGRGGSPSAQFMYGTATFKYMIFGDPSWDYTRYDLSNWRRDTQMFRSFADASNASLDRFKARRGRLILAHGWADPAVNALSTIGYYQRLTIGDSQVNDYARLFLLPGVLHCGGGPGPDVVDWQSAIVDWVESGKAPDRLVARKLGAGEKSLRTRPLCPYPERAVYAGSGDIDDQASFVCRQP